MFLKKIPNCTNIQNISNGMDMSLFPHCLSALEMYIGRLNYQFIVYENNQGFPDMDKMCEEKLGCHRTQKLLSNSQ